MCACGKTIKARGLCGTCYERWRRANPSEVLNNLGKWDGVICANKGCDNPVRAKWLCMKHLQRLYYLERKYA